MKYDAILFDMDGTVVDSLQDICDAVNHAMRHYDLPEFEPEQIKPQLGYGAWQLLRRVLPADAADTFVDEVLEYYKPYYAEHTGDKTRPYAGVLPMMERLRAQGLRLAIISNKPDSAVQPLVTSYFADLVDLAVGETPAVRRKPWPDMIESAARRLGVDMKRCLYVGDSEVDIDTAKNAGIDCAAVTWGFRSREELVRAGATVIVDTPEKLTAYIEL